LTKRRQQAARQQPLFFVPWLGWRCLTTETNSAASFGKRRARALLLVWIVALLMQFRSKASDSPSSGLLNSRGRAAGFPKATTGGSRESKQSSRHHHPSSTPKIMSWGGHGHGGRAGGCPCCHMGDLEVRAGEGIDRSMGLLIEKSTAALLLTAARMSDLGAYEALACWRRLPLWH